jgi:hypothetical protein
MTGEKDNSEEIANMRWGNRVEISPIHSGKYNFSLDDESLDMGDKSFEDMEHQMEPLDLDKEIMPPPTAPRVRNAPRILSSFKVKDESNTEDFFDMQINSTPQPVTQDEGSPRIMTLGSLGSSHRLMKQLTATPSTAATVEQSFWSDQLDMTPGSSLSPLRSPGTEGKATDDMSAKSSKTRSPIFDKSGVSPSTKRRREQAEGGNNQ